MIGFYWARFNRKEAHLARWSLPKANLLKQIENKSVAIVGNARALSSTAQGPAIDGADIVIRLNSAPIPQSRSHGTRTDWLAMSTPVPQTVIDERAPSTILWMTRKRKRLPWRIARDPRFFLNPRYDASALTATLGSSASTGALVIDLVRRSRASAITLHGFDFFASKSMTGRRSAEHVPHDFAAEQRWIMALINTDFRMTIVSTTGLA